MCKELLEKKIGKILTNCIHIQWIKITVNISINIWAELLQNCVWSYFYWFIWVNYISVVNLDTYLVKLDLGIKKKNQIDKFCLTFRGIHKSGKTDVVEIFKNKKFCYLVWPKVMLKLKSPTKNEKLCQFIILERKWTSLSLYQ